MDNSQQQLERLAEIRSLMERSTRFLSLSGLSGVWAGFCALVGAYYYRNFIEAAYLRPHSEVYVEKVDRMSRGDFEMVLISTAFGILLAAILGGLFFTARKARNRGERVWDVSSRRLLKALLIPLFTGGIFCLALLYWGFVGFVAPATLVFYGLALINGSKHTIGDVASLGYVEILLGLAGLFVPGYGLEIWALGSGGFHVLYGGWMYFKYER